MTTPLDINSPAARALRSIQKLDQCVSWIGLEIIYRRVLLEAEGALGKALGLECTGEHEGDCHYDHSGDTCPVHEWLVPEDAAVAEALREVAARDPSLLSDEAALDALNTLLSAPEWPGASGMEDVLGIVRRTGRVEVPGAPDWARH